ncbi:MAG: hypothetical protein B5M53_02205 [Candidatus Cloacimonas sp. 4484_209]|nr:MAG: hypothetical protein B5M53_02205 [Candidatus Cloacimonas sp. 4484_209]
MKRLIINADGYGFTYGINRGIEEAVTNGVVTSISVNANFESVFELEGFLKRNPKISVGVHLNPIVGRPIAKPNEVPTLVDDKGEFHYKNFSKRLLKGKINLKELEYELSLQIERVQKLCPHITHIDSHQNRHLYPRYFSLFLRLAQKYGIKKMRTHKYFICAEREHRKRDACLYYLKNPIRILTHAVARIEMGWARAKGMIMADRLLAVGYVGHANKSMIQSWLQIIRNIPDGVSEIYCHPGYIDDVLLKYATYVKEREQELKILCSKELKDSIRENDIHLISFYDL